MAMPHFEWTGTLRPEVISPRRHVPEEIRLPDYAMDGVPRSEAQSAQRNTREFSQLTGRKHMVVT